MSYLPPAAAALAEALRQRGLLVVVERRAAEHHVTVADVLGASRTKSVVAARHAIIRDLRETGRSAPEIGALVGRDHSSVLAVLKKPVAKTQTRCSVLAITRVV